MPAILILLPKEMFSGKILNVCRSIGSDLHALDNSLHTHHWKRLGFRSYTAIPFFVEDEINPVAIERIKEICQRRAIDVVVPIDLEAAAFLSIACPYIPQVRLFPFGSLDTLRLLANKHSCADLAAAAGLDVPGSVLITSIDELKSARLSEVTYPVVVKPPRLDGRRGVTLVESRDQLYSHVQKIANLGQLPLILQEYIEGVDIDVDLIARDGKVIFQIGREGGDSRGALFFRDAALESAAEAIVHASGYTGLANLDFVRESTTGRYKFIEFNPRAWDRIWLSALGGVNFIKLGIELALDQAMPVDLSRSRFSVFTLSGAIVAHLKGRGADVSDYNRKALVWDLTHPISALITRIEAKLFARRARRASMAEASLFRMSASSRPMDPALPFPIPQDALGRRVSDLGAAAEI